MKLNRFAYLLSSFLVLQPIPCQAAAPVGAAKSIAPAGLRVDIALQETRIGNLTPLQGLLNDAELGRSERALLRAQEAAALLRSEEARRAIDDYFEGNDTDPARQAMAHEIAAETSFAAGDYRRAAYHTRQLRAFSDKRTKDEVEGTERLARIAESVAGVAPTRMERATDGREVGTFRDKVGLIRTRMEIGSVSEDAILDSGANISVVSASAAQRLGLKILDASTEVGNSVGGSVDVKLAVAGRLHLAGAEFRNVLFLVIKDEALTFPVPGGYRIDAIIGLPVLRAAGRLKFGPGDILRVEAPTKDAGPSNMTLIGNDPFVQVKVRGVEHPLFFDSGANRSSLSARFAAEHPDFEGAEIAHSNKAGAGGAEVVKLAKLKDVPIAINGSEAVLPAMEMESQAKEGDRRYGVLGADMLSLFRSFTIDWNAMRLEVEGKP